MSDICEAAQDLAARGWPVIPVRAHGKEPLTKNGVKDATTDERTLLHWFERWPDANLGVACGAPGPTVLDIDDLAGAQWVLATLKNSPAPTVATTRGRHIYFRGLEQSTIALGYGELRGHGSYVVAPPSIHPSGKLYTWLQAPNGELPPVPGTIAADRKPAGAGVRPARDRVPHGERHGHLKDLAVRLARSGITQADAIERALVAEYEAVCDKQPPAKAGSFADLAKWAASTDIAARENERQSAQQPEEPKRSKRALPAPPARDASLKELREFIAAGLGAPDVVAVTNVTRMGVDALDAMIIDLSNDMRIVFGRQGDVMVPKVWQSTVLLATNGIVRPGYLKISELGDLMWALCVVSNAAVEAREEDDLRDVVDSFLTLCEPVMGHTLVEPAAKYRLLAHLQTLAPYAPKDRSDAKPVVVIDSQTQARYVRAGELVAHADHVNLGVHRGAFPGRMLMIGLQRHEVRAWDRTDRQRSKQLRASLYELPGGEG